MDSSKGAQNGHRLPIGVWAYAMQWQHCPLALVHNPPLRLYLPQYPGRVMAGDVDTCCWSEGCAYRGDVPAVYVFDLVVARQIAPLI